MAKVEVSTKPSGEFRSCLPDLDHPRFKTMQQQDAHEYVEAFLSKQNPPWLYNLFRHWRDLFEEPYKGITNDGKELHRDMDFNFNTGLCRHSEGRPIHAPG